MIDFDGAPDFVNEAGVKWWKDTHTTLYAQKPDKHGTMLEAVCFYLEEPSGKRTRVLIDKDRQIIAEDQTMDGIGIKIDVLKFLKRDGIKDASLPNIKAARRSWKKKK